MGAIEILICIYIFTCDLKAEWLAFDHFLTHQTVPYDLQSFDHCFLKSLYLIWKKIVRAKPERKIDSEAEVVA